MKIYLLSLSLLVTVLFFGSCQSQVIHDKGTPSHHFTVAERLYLLIQTLSQKSEYHVLRNKQTGKIAVSLQFPIYQISQLALTHDTVKMMAWVQRYNKILLDFVMGDDCALYEGFDYCLFNSSTDSCYASFNLAITDCDTSNHMGLSTREKLDCLVETFPDKTVYLCNNSKHTITFYIDSYFDSWPGLEKSLDDDSKRYSLLAFAYVLLHDTRYTTLEYIYTNTNSHYEKETFTYQYHTSDTLFKNIQGIFPKRLYADWLSL